LTDHQLENVRSIRRNIEDKVDLLRKHIEESSYIPDNEWQKMDEMIDAIYTGLINLRDEIY